jgi:predicted ATPase
MFKRLYIDNYKCLVNFELPLQELSLLLGPNGVGKTSVLDVIFALRQLLGGVARVTDPDIFPTPSLTRWQSRDLQVFELDVALDEDELTYRIEIEHERSTKRARLHLEKLTADGRPLFSFELGQVQLYKDDHTEGPRYSADWSESALARVPSYGEQNRRLTAFLDFMRKVMVCGLYPASFKAESTREDALLDRDAHNFAAWYRHALQERPDLVPEFTKALQDVIDGFDGIRLEKVGQDTRALMVTLQEQKQRYELRFDEISDGQRALIALYALVRLAAGQGYTLFLDEPDNYVALAEIQPWLIELSDASGESVPQAVLCSHHPELIDYLGGERGILLCREASGVIKARNLDKRLHEGGLKLSEAVARGWER